MNRRKKQLIITLLLLIAGLTLGFAFGLLIIPSKDSQSAQTASNYNTAGDAESNIRIIEYSDYECHYCALFYQNIYEKIILPEIENNTVFYRYRDYPLETFDNNLDASFAAHCAGEQNKFWEMHDKLFRNQNSWLDKEKPTEMFKKIAQDIDINSKEFDQCLDSKSHHVTIQNSIDAGKKLKIKTTPTIFINDQKIEGLKSVDYYRNIIANEIKKAE